MTNSTQPTDGELDAIVKGITEWRKLTYDPEHTKVELVVTPGEAKKRLDRREQRAALQARIDERLHTATVKFEETDGNWYEGIGYEEIEDGIVLSNEARLGTLNQELQALEKQEEEV